MCVLGLPVSERFAFCLNTILSDISPRSVALGEDIIGRQIDVLEDLTHKVTKLCKDDDLGKEKLCKLAVVFDCIHHKQRGQL